MKCFECEGNLAPTVNTFKTNVHGKSVTVPDVPALECETCSEVYYEADASRYIDEQVRLQTKEDTV